MQLNENKIKKIFERYKQSFIEMEHYDKTREKLWAKKRLDITLNQRTINNLKDLSKKSGKPVSHLIEEAILSKLTKIKAKD